MATLSRKIYELGIAEERPEAVVWDVEELPAGALPEGYDGVSDERNLREWMVRYGMAYVVARIEEPFASEEAWQRKAREAATEAHRWHFNVGGAPEIEEVMA